MRRWGTKASSRGGLEVWCIDAHPSARLHPSTKLSHTTACGTVTWLWTAERRSLRDGLRSMGRPQVKWPLAHAVRWNGNH